MSHAVDDHLDQGLEALEPGQGMSGPACGFNWRPITPEAYRLGISPRNSGWCARIKVVIRSATFRTGGE